MPTVNPSAFGPKPFWVDSAGNPSVSYKLFMYAAGSTSTKQNSYTNSTGSVANTNPIILNALGQTPNELWWDASLIYKVVLAPSTDTDPPTNPVWTVDNLQGMNSGSGTTAANEWVLYSASAIAFVNASSFTLVGNQTLTFHIGRRLQLMTSAGFVYGRITNSVFAASTTITVQMDGSQVLDSGLSAVYYSILSNNVLSLPERIATASGTNTYTATVGISNLVIGDIYKIRFPNANTTIPTLALDVGSALAIVTQNGAIPSPSQINGQHLIEYNGTNFTVLNPFQSGFLINTIYYSVVSQNVTMTIASPCVVTYASSDKLPLQNAPIVFSTSGTLPTGIVAGTTYYVKSPSGTTSNISTVPSGTSINTSGTQSGTQSVSNPSYLKATNSPNFIISEVWGGGGGGGGASTGTGGAGGGAGGFSRQKILSTSILSSETITIGAAGLGGANTGATGGTGGTSSFGSHSSSTGGIGGSGVNALALALGGLGGSGIGGDLNLNGNPGISTPANISGYSAAGGGGASILGGAAIGLVGATGTSGANAFPSSASGGSGAVSQNSAQIGGNGGSGLVIIYEYT